MSRVNFMFGWVEHEKNHYLGARSDTNEILEILVIIKEGLI